MKKIPGELGSIAEAITTSKHQDSVFPGNIMRFLKRELCSTYRLSMCLSEPTSSYHRTLLKKKEEKLHRLTLISPLSTPFHRLTLQYTREQRPIPKYTTSIQPPTNPPSKPPFQIYSPLSHSHSISLAPPRCSSKS